MFFFVYAIFTLTIFDLGQRLIIWPAVWLFPLKRRAIVRRWLRFLAKISLWISRVFGGVRVTTVGTAPTESCLLVMNHQSLLDITISVNAARGPQAVIPDARKIRPRHPGHILADKTRPFPPRDATAEARRKPRLPLCFKPPEISSNGETTLIIYPEGHRTTDGTILPFMRSGLRLILQRAQRPDLLHRLRWPLARTNAQGSDPLVREQQCAASSFEVRFRRRTRSTSTLFINELHARMTATLAEIRHQFLTTPTRRR